METQQRIQHQHPLCRFAFLNSSNHVLGRFGFLLFYILELFAQGFHVSPHTFLLKKNHDTVGLIYYLDSSLLRPLDKNRLYCWSQCVFRQRQSLMNTKPTNFIIKCFFEHCRDSSHFIISDFYFDYCLNSSLYSGYTKCGHRNQQWSEISYEKSLAACL